MSADDPHRARAEAQFKRPDVQSTAEAKAKAERDREEAARDANTERLKALRLAREASARDAVATNEARRQVRKARR